MTAGEANVAAVAASKQRGVDAVGGAGRGLALTAGVLHVVVEALRNEDKVGKAKVDGKGNDGRDETSPERACEVGNVANEPDNQEGERDAIGRARGVVLNELWDLCMWALAVYGRKGTRTAWWAWHVL